jgi:hypothetical protein
MTKASFSMARFIHPFIATQVSQPVHMELCYFLSLGEIPARMRDRAEAVLIERDPSGIASTPSRDDAARPLLPPRKL